MIIKNSLIDKKKSFLDKQILLFYGQNHGLKEEFKKNIKNKFIKSKINHLNQDEILKDQDKFFTDLFNVSLFEEQKIFIISLCNDKILGIIEEIENKIETQQIFLFSDLLDKNLN